MEYLESFSLRDFLIFSSESYFTLFEISNKALWPLHILLAFLVISALILLYKRHRLASRIIFLWLGIVWGFVAYSYFGVYYSQISTYAHYFSYTFWIQACLLFIYAIFANHQPANATKEPYTKWRLLTGTGLMLYGLLIHPVVSLLIWNQPLTRAELFSIAPDPTAIATIGFVLLLPVKGHLLLVAIPILWILLSITTYQAF